MKDPTLCIAVLNYNGIPFLEELVPTLRVALRKWMGQCSVVILDNQSTEADHEWIEKYCPDFELVTAQSNEMLFSYNDFIANRTENIIILLNNDIKVDENFIAPLVSHFKYDDVFSVGATSRDWVNKNYTCGPWNLWKNHGLYYWGCDTAVQKLSHTLITVGGFMAIDRRKFLELGGFNRLFYPAYCEETELCFKAWRKGWRCIFEPKSLVYHYDGGTFQKFSQRRSTLQLRASFLFQWACLPEIKPKCLIRLLMFMRCLRYSLTMKYYWPVTYFKTKSEWNRVKQHYSNLRTDSEELKNILKKINLPVPESSDH